MPPLIPDDEVRAYLDSLPPTLRSLVWLLSVSGTRLEECGPLRWDQVDPARSAITLHSTKNSTARQVQLERSDLGRLLAVPRHITSPHVFWSGRDGGPPRNLSSRLAVYRRKLGVAWVTHDIRHDYAIWYLRRARGSIYGLQRQLGHKSIKQTEAYLDHLTPDEARVVREMVG